MFKIHYNLLCSSITKINSKKELFNETKILADIVM